MGDGSSLWRWDTDGVGSAGADGTAGDGLAAFIETDLDGGEVVVAAAEGERRGRDFGIGLSDEVEDLCGWKRDLTGELGESGRHDERLEGGTCSGEERVGREAGAGAVGTPLMLQEACVGVDVGELRGIGRAGCVGAVLWIGAVGVLWP